MNRKDKVQEALGRRMLVTGHFKGSVWKFTTVGQYAYEGRVVVNWDGDKVASTELQRVVFRSKIISSEGGFLITDPDEEFVGVATGQQETLVMKRDARREGWYVYSSPAFSLHPQH
jgi:hypothetical protein